jgi:hypothetical protein
MNLVFLKNFNGHLQKYKFKYSYDVLTYFFSGESMLSKLYLSECSLTKMFSYRYEKIDQYFI